MVTSRTTWCSRCPGTVERAGMTRMVTTPSMQFFTYRCTRCGNHTLIHNVRRMPPGGIVFSLILEAAAGLLEPVPAV